MIEGGREIGSFQSLDFEFVPCNVRIAGLKETVPENCVADKQKQIDYLGDFNLIYLAN